MLVSAFSGLLCWFRSIDTLNVGMFGGGRWGLEASQEKKACYQVFKPSGISGMSGLVLKMVRLRRRYMPE
jgi:hypothetical protein